MKAKATKGEDRVRAVLYLNGLRGDELEDGLQEVRLRTLQSPPRDPDALDRWMAVVATNVAIDKHRAAKRQTETMARLRSVAPAEDRAPHDVLLRETVARGLAELEADQRAVVVLRFYEDRPLEEIASVLELPLGTVKSRLHRAVKHLRELLPREEVYT